MSSRTTLPRSWSERAADDSPSVRRARARQTEQAQAIIDAAQRLISERADRFTIQELAKEAGVALQTFYRLFGSKDRLLLAVLETMIAEYCTRIDEAVSSLSDPVARLRFIITSTVSTVGIDEGEASSKFITAQHWRLYQLFPDDMSRATQPFSDLVARHADIAAANGLLARTDPEHDAWLVTQLVIAVFHHYAFAETPIDAEAIGGRLWSFCGTALGARTDRTVSAGSS